MDQPPPPWRRRDSEDDKGVVDAVWVVVVVASFCPAPPRSKATRSTAIESVGLSSCCSSSSSFDGGCTKIAVDGCDGCICCNVTRCHCDARVCTAQPCSMLAVGGQSKVNVHASTSWGVELAFLLESWLLLSECGAMTRRKEEGGWKIAEGRCEENQLVSG